MQLPPTLAALAFAAAAQGSAPIVIDTDMGTDDIMAISLLLSHPEIPIEAITVVHGLAHVPAGCANARRLVDASGRQSVAVFGGRSAPLQHTAEFPKAWRDASDASLTHTEPVTPLRPERAEVWLASRIQDASNPVRILALGPLTNVAVALEHAKHGAVAEIVIMGGAFKVPGNLGDGGHFATENPSAEWNFFADPEAATRVFRSGVPIRVIPLDATNQVKIDTAFVDHFRTSAHGPLAPLVAKMLLGQYDMVKQGMFYAWDPLAATAMLDPEVAPTTPIHVTIEVTGTHVGASRIGQGRPNAHVAFDARKDRFEQIFLGTFSR